MLDLFIKQTCNADGYMDLDIMYMSELDPTWNNDELAFFTNPEAAAVANPIAAAACTADAVSSTAGKPLKQLFWCAGSWGTLYPFSGNQNGGKGVIRDSSLLSTRVLAALHRRGLAWKTMGSEAMCRGVINYPKRSTNSRYCIRFQRQTHLTWRIHSYVGSGANYTGNWARPYLHHLAME
ncbi:hypothetical protein BANRA_05466 [Klebsiella pneumoniae]|nr:hypothetical protein BANRA_05466 [Klebsiella pneumoniae]